MNTPCDFEQLSETKWRCRRCGKMLVTGKLADGSVIQPKWNQLPPCGWTPFRVESGGHRWMEIFGPDGQRHWRCVRCQRRISLPGQTADAQAESLLAQQPPCQGPPQQPAQTDANAPGQPPGLLQRAWNYSKALARWIAEGRPTRPPAEIQRILEICRACSKYDPKEGICRLCGCRINLDKEAWRNKLAMATEACPLCKWGCKLSEEELKRFVSCAYVIASDPYQRLASKLIDTLHGPRWPFVIPTIYKLTDADRSEAIRRLSLNNRLLGRQMTHLQALHDGFSGGVDSVLVMEDCAYIADNFTEQVSEFLASVPKDWECIVLGGEHAFPPQATDILGVVRVRSMYRVYAYIARPSYMKALQKALSEETIVDWAVDDCCQRGTIYAPEACLVTLSPECSNGRHWVIVDCNTLSKVLVTDIQDTLPYYDGKIVRVVVRNEPICGVVILSEDYDIKVDDADLISEFRSCNECSA